MREGWEDLQILRLQQWRQDQLVAAGVEHLHVAEPMIHLYPLARSCEETLMHGVHGQRHIVALRMPIAVGSGSFRGVRLRLHPRLTTVFLYQRTASLTTHLHRDTVGVCAVGGMAVEATARHDGLRQDGIFLEGVQVALVDADVAAHLIAGLDTAIGQSPLVEPVLTDEDVKVLILSPFPVLLDADGEGHLAALVLFCQFVPVVDVEVRPVTIDMYLSTLAAFHDHIHAVNILIGKVEIQRRNVRRDRHPDIVWIDLRQLLHHHDILWRR